MQWRCVRSSHSRIPFLNFQPHPGHFFNNSPILLFIALPRCRNDAHGRASIHHSTCFILWFFCLLRFRSVSAFFLFARACLALSTIFPLAVTAVENAIKSFSMKFAFSVSAGGGHIDKSIGELAKETNIGCRTATINTTGKALPVALIVFPQHIHVISKYIYYISSNI